MQLPVKIIRTARRAFLRNAALVRAIVRRLRAGEPKGFCVACNKPVFAFLPYEQGASAMSPLMKALAMVGSDVDHFSCPKCWAHDRERHLLLYFSKLDFKNRIRNGRVLHFAPEPAIKRFIESAAPAEYIRGDLFPANDDIQRLDLCALPFANDSFDIVIANHVLEHVADDARALAEIFRILKPGGMAVLQTPFASALSTTFEDPAVTDPELRLHLFGQEDHVRLYGSDIFRRFSASGMVSEMQPHAQLLPDMDFRVYGVNPKEPLMLFAKSAN